MGDQEAIVLVPGEVQHCNRRTDFEMIRHTFDPFRCKECEGLAELLGGYWVTWENYNPTRHYQAPPSGLNRDIAMTGIVGDPVFDRRPPATPPAEPPAADGNDSPYRVVLTTMVPVVPVDGVDGVGGIRRMTHSWQPRTGRAGFIWSLELLDPDGAPLVRIPFQIHDDDVRTVHTVCSRVGGDDDEPEFEIRRVEF